VQLLKQRPKYVAVVLKSNIPAGIDVSLVHPAIKLANVVTVLNLPRSSGSSGNVVKLLHPLKFNVLKLQFLPQEIIVFINNLSPALLKANPPQAPFIVTVYVPAVAYE
jgi:hypothetical protein